MISITYSGWLCIVAVLLICNAVLSFYIYAKLKYLIMNTKEQQMIDSRSLATILNSMNKPNG